MARTSGRRIRHTHHSEFKVHVGLTAIWEGKTTAELYPCFEPYLKHVN